MALNFANNQSLSAITALPAGISGGALTLLETQTASASATISFTSNIDSTYKAYVFKFYDIHPATDAENFQFNGSTDSGSNYNVTKTTTAFYAYHDESGASSALNYSTGQDIAQGTGFQTIAGTIGSDNDQSGSGELWLFNPSSTTFVKHFINTASHAQHGDSAFNWFSAGYFNTTSAIDAIQFKQSSGNIDSGVIKLYGIS